MKLRNVIIFAIFVCKGKVLMLFRICIRVRCKFSSILFKSRQNIKVLSTQNFINFFDDKFRETFTIFINTFPRTLFFNVVLESRLLNCALLCL